MKSIIVPALILSIWFALDLENASAQVPRLLNYQGTVNDNLGKPVPDGSHSITFQLYKSLTGGVPVFSETQNVAVTKGIFSSNIGSSTPIPASVKFDSSYYLGITIDGGAELSPRTLLVAAPYTLFAANAANALTANTTPHADIADMANSLSANATGVVRSVNGQQGDLLLVGEGAVKITSVLGTISISAPPPILQMPYSASGMNVAGPVFSIINTGSTGASIQASNSSGGSGLSTVPNSVIWGDAGLGYYGVVGSSKGGLSYYAGVLGQGVGLAAGVSAIADLGDGIISTSNNGRAGSFALINADSKANALEASTTGLGDAILGSATAAGSHGVHGISYGSSNSTGVFGESLSQSVGTNALVGPSGVMGLTTTGPTPAWSAGVRGINPNINNSGFGVIGYQAGAGAGVYGETPGGIGVYGKVTDVTANNFGVTGETVSPNGAGIKATYTGTGIGTPLQLDNGAIKVTGANKSAFVYQVTNANRLNNTDVELDNPLCNGDPNCLIYVSFLVKDLNSANLGNFKQTLGVFYDTTRNKWQIISMNQQTFFVPTFFNVLVIKQ